MIKMKFNMRNLTKCGSLNSVYRGSNLVDVTKFAFSSKSSGSNSTPSKSVDSEESSIGSSSTSSSSSISQASKEFEKKINSVTKDEEDYSSIEQYMKVFNEKVYKQNVELTNKLAEIFKEESSTPPSGSKIFTAVNEINKINLNNSSKLLQVFLSQILKYNDSVRLFIQQSEKKNTRFNYLLPLSLFFLWLCGGTYLYSYYKRNFVNYDKTFDNLIKYYNDNAPKLFKINIKFPIFDDHKNVTNALNFDQHKHIVLIGPHSIGKTESVKHFCLTQSLKDVLTIYIDLNTLNNYSDSNSNSLQSIIRDKLIENYTGKDITNLNREVFLTQDASFKLFEFLKSKTVYFVFDNYDHQRDREVVMNNSIPNIVNNSNWRSLVVTDNNEVYRNSLENNLEVKYVNFVQTRTYKNYLVEKLNTFVKKRVEFSNLELFEEENINNLFRNFHYFSYEDLFRYLEANNSIENYIKSKEEIVLKKLRVLRIQEPQAYDLLGKLVTASGNKHFDWNKLPGNANSEGLRSLERSGLIFSRDYAEYVLLYAKLKDIMNKVEKN